MKYWRKFCPWALAMLMTVWHPLCELFNLDRKRHFYAQSKEPEHIHPELLQPGYLTTSGSAIAGPASAPVPFVASDDDQQQAMAVAVMRSREEQLQRLAYLDDSPFIPSESLPQ